MHIMWTRKLPDDVAKTLYFVTPYHQSQPRSRSNARIGKGTSFGSCLSKITICCTGTSGPASENRQVDGTEGGMKGERERIQHTSRDCVLRESFSG